jgi:hypothetical protein
MLNVVGYYDSGDDGVCPLVQYLASVFPDMVCGDVIEGMFSHFYDAVV